MVYDPSQDYGVKNPDGSVTVYNPTNVDANGVYVPVRTESWAVNQGTPAPAAAPSGATAGDFTGGNAVLPLQLQQLNQAYLDARLRELEIPTLNLSREQNDWQRMQSLANLTGYLNTGGTPTMTADQALDAIWAKRPDLAQFYRDNGWAVDTIAQQRAAAQNWLGMSPEGQAAGGNPVKAAQSMGIDVGVTGGTQAPTLAREQWLTDKAMAEAGLTGLYGGQQTVAEKQRAIANALSEAGLTGTYNGQDTLARDQMQQQNEQYYGGLKAQLSGPRDWIRYSQVQPTGAFGAMQATPSYESAGIGTANNTDWWQNVVSTPKEASLPGGGQGVAPALATGAPSYPEGGGLVYTGGTPNFDESTGTYRTGAPTNPVQNSAQNWWEQPVRQPHQIRVQDYNNMSDTEKQMQEGLWSAQGVRPEDAWKRFNAAAPKGTGSTQVRWV